MTIPSLPAPLAQNEKDASEPCPRILSQTEFRVSPWVRLMAREVLFHADQPPQVYHSLAQADYLAIVARTPQGLIPIVKQYRPAIGDFTWELPAGLLETGEDPTEACRRELLEETGLTAHHVHSLGAWQPDTGRLTNHQHVFFVEASEPDPTFVAEDGMTIEFVTLEELKDRIRSRQFKHQLHVAALYLAELHAA